MEDMVEYFEEFIKKALIIIFIAISVILAILLYIVKVIRREQCSSRRPLLCQRSSVSSLNALGISGVPPPVDFCRPINVITSPDRAAAMQCSKKQEVDFNQEKIINQDTYVDAKCSRVRFDLNF